MRLHLQNENVSGQQMADVVPGFARKGSPKTFVTVVKDKEFEDNFKAILEKIKPRKTKKKAKDGEDSTEVDDGAPIPK